MSLQDLCRGITIVTGTDTDVGKTVATAALAALLQQQGIDFAVVKPAQTGITPAEEGDLAQVGRLAAVPAERLHEWVRLPEPLAPTTAARRAGRAVPSVAEMAERVATLAAAHQALLVEGAGGVLVGLDADGNGLLELAQHLQDAGHRPRFVVVTRSGLGTLNHTALTARAIREAGHDVAGLIVGAWPDEPSLAERCNAVDLPALAPVLGVLPAGIGTDAGAVSRALTEGAPPSWTAAITESETR